MAELPAQSASSGTREKKRRSREEEGGERDGKRRKRDSDAPSQKKHKKKDNTEDAQADDAEAAADDAAVEAALSTVTRPAGAMQPTRSLEEILNTSGGDLMDVLQALDVSQLGGVMKGLNSTATASKVQLHPITSTMPTGASAPRATKAAAPSKPKKATGSSDKKGASGIRTKAPPASIEGYDASNPAEMLATRWWRATQLNQLAKEHGLVFKKGKFTAAEERQLNSAMELAAKERGCSIEGLDAVIFPKSDEDRDSAFWTALARAVPQRPLNSVYHHVRRKRNPLAGQGRWTEAEDDALRSAVLEHGEQWEKKVSAVVGRSASDCRDRWRNHVKHRDERTSGQWTQEEEDNLTRIITEWKVENGKEDDEDIPWTLVAAKMKHGRGRTQCRMKWTESLRFRVAKVEKRWSKSDSFILVQKIDSLDVEDETEIDWNSLADPDWNMHSGHTMQRRWRQMKQKIDGHEKMSHKEVMGALLSTVQYVPPSKPSKPIAQPTPSAISEPSKPPKPRKRKLSARGTNSQTFTSKEFVSDSDMD
ncbi:unnamed protein product [Peniophora sp. CBMAI 1063]|nr:unnamed protein product [Peniophora sp. CBMAI 1063]